MLFLSEAVSFDRSCQARFDRWFQMMNWIRRLVILPILFYQRFISPMLGPHCRFHPSCSSYAVEAITTYGVFFGGLKAVTRLLRCHPLFPGGYDPVENGWPRVKPRK